MRLQIKTLNQKSIMIDIEPTKTVYDLKKELTLYPDVGVKPELQKLIYAGKILSNDDPLSVYNIDVKKFLVVMILKQPLEDAPTTSQSAPSASASASGGATAVATDAQPPAADVEQKAAVKVEAVAVAPTAASAAPQAESTEFRQPATPATPVTGRSQTDEMVENIVSMGYPESEVRRALAASFNTPERAIEYLIEGIPDSVAASAEEAAFGDTEMNVSPFEIFRSDPLFRNLRRAIQQHPELIDDAIQRVGEANPAILNLINENQQEFLSSLIEGSDDEDDDDADE